jgi:cytochrome P450
MNAAGAPPSTNGPPSPVSFNPAWWILHDIKAEWRARGTFPPGPTSFSLSRTHQMLVDPLHLLLDCYKQYGPVFSLRAFHQREVFMLGPEANHYITVSHAHNFHWRESHFGDMIPLLGDGLLTIDGDYHRRARRIMLPAFHREQIVLAVETMIEETQRMIDSWRPGEVIDVYHRARELTMRVAMRALLGLDPDDSGKGESAAIHFERALSYYGTEALPRIMRGPGTPWRRMQASVRVLDEIVYGEITRRRDHPDSSRADILSLLLEARDEEDGSGLSDREVRDQAITLMFAGHDTTASTITFLLYELARNPEALARLIDEQDQVLGGAVPTAEQLYGGLPQLEMAVAETLRLYPPAWIGSRYSVREFEFAGVHVPAGAYVHYSSWASHRLPEVFPEPDAFIPDRFAPEARAKLPRGAYVPFGGGTRTCIGMRFGEIETRTVATLILRRCRLDLIPGDKMTVRQMPTLGPRGGLDMVVRDRSGAGRQIQGAVV